MKRTFILFVILILITTFPSCSSTKKQNINNNTKDSSTTLNVDQENSEQINSIITPDFIGMDKESALETINSIGLKVEWQEKYLVYKKDTSQGYEDDNIILEQSISPGTIIAKGSTITLTYNINQSVFKYTINDDNTITLTDYERIKKETDKSIIVPREYKGMKVSRIQSALLQRVNSYRESGYTIKIPKEVTIVGDTTATFERY